MLRAVSWIKFRRNKIAQSPGAVLARCKICLAREFRQFLKIFLQYLKQFFLLLFDRFLGSKRIEDSPPAVSCWVQQTPTAPLSSLQGRFSLRSPRKQNTAIVQALPSGQLDCCAVTAALPNTATRVATSNTHALPFIFGAALNEKLPLSSLYFVCT